MSTSLDSIVNALSEDDRNTVLERSEELLNEERDRRLVDGLMAIALFPITDPKNQDAWNMQKMAMDALRWRDVSECEVITKQKQKGP